MARVDWILGQDIINSKYISKFFSVGIVGAVIDNLLLIGGVELLGLTPVVAKVISAESAILFMFAINEYWTFASCGAGGKIEVVKRLVRSNLVRVLGLFVATTTLYLAHRQLNIAYLLANVLGISVGFVVNYVFESVFTWQVS